MAKIYKVWIELEEYDSETDQYQVLDTPDAGCWVPNIEEANRLIEGLQSAIPDSFIARSEKIEKKAGWRK